MTRISTPVLQKVGGKAVAQRARADAPDNACGLCCILHHAVPLTGGDRVETVLPVNNQPTDSIAPCSRFMSNLNSCQQDASCITSIR
jgi:hypothetical protein